MKERGPQGPHCSLTQWRRGASSLVRSCCGNYSTRAGSSCSRFFPQQSFRLGLATLAQRLVDYSLFSPSGCGCHCATPFLRRVQCRSGSQTLQERQRLFPYCSLFSTFLRLCPHDALHHFTALSGHWPFARDSEVSDCQPMPLRVGTREWAYLLFLRRDRVLCVPLHPSQYEFDGFRESVSSVYTRVLAGLSVQPLHGRLALSMRP